MNMPVSLFLALRYLRPKRSFLSVVSVISVLGVLIGVAVMIIVLSVMSGFDLMWREKILSFNAHITVTGWGGIDDAEETLERLHAMEGVTGAAPFLQGLVFIQHAGQVLTPFLRGVHAEYEPRVSRIPEHMVQGHFSLEPGQVLIGTDLARQLGVTVGDELLALAPQSFTGDTWLRLPEELTVSGLFEVGMWEFDAGYALTSLGTARDLFAMETGIHGVQIMTRDPFRARQTAEHIQATLGRGYEVRPWMDLNRQLFAALRVEKNIMFFLLIFITVVAAFGITNTLITVTVQKTREIGLLKALGFRPLSIMGIFLWQGGMAGLIGTLAGTGVGLLILRYRNAMMNSLSHWVGFELLPKELYHLSEIPAHTSTGDVLTVTLSVLVICTLAGLVPAYRAARLDPARALHYE